VSSVSTPLAAPAAGKSAPAVSSATPGDRGLERARRTALSRLVIVHAHEQPAACLDDARRDRRDGRRVREDHGGTAS
jgi:hypothetical protein